MREVREVRRGEGGEVREMRGGEVRVKNEARGVINVVTVCKYVHSVRQNWRRPFPHLVATAQIQDMTSS